VFRDKAEKRKKQLKAAKIAEEEERRQFCERRFNLHLYTCTVHNSLETQRCPGYL